MDKSITGQHQYFYNVESLLLQDGSITTDPVQTHNKLTKAFAEHFVCPQYHIHSPLQADDGVEHERFFTDFKTTVTQITNTIT